MDSIKDKEYEKNITINEYSYNERKDKTQYDLSLFNDDCMKVLPLIESNSVDLIITSPPYADQRKSTYGGVSPNKYVEWFTPIAIEL